APSRRSRPIAPRVIAHKRRRSVPRSRGPRRASFSWNGTKFGLINLSASAVHLAPLAGRGRIASSDAIRVRGALHLLRPMRLPFTPTLSPQAGRGGASSVPQEFSLASRPSSSRFVLRRDAQAGGVEDVYVLSLRSQRRLVAHCRRVAAADFGDKQ